MLVLECDGCKEQVKCEHEMFPSAWEIFDNENRWKEHRYDSLEKLYDLTVKHHCPRCRTDGTLASEQE